MWLPAQAALESHPFAAGASVITVLDEGLQDGIGWHARLLFGQRNMGVPALDGAYAFAKALAENPRSIFSAVMYGPIQVSDICLEVSAGSPAPADGGHSQTRHQHVCSGSAACSWLLVRSTGPAQGQHRRASLWSHMTVSLPPKQIRIREHGQCPMVPAVICLLSGSWLNWQAACRSR